MRCTGDPQQAFRASHANTTLLAPRTLPTVPRCGNEPVREHPHHLLARGPHSTTFQYSATPRIEGCHLRCTGDPQQAFFGFALQLFSLKRPFAPSIICSCLSFSQNFGTCFHKQLALCYQGPAFILPCVHHCSCFGIKHAFKQASARHPLLFCCDAGFLPSCTSRCNAPLNHFSKCSVCHTLQP